MELAMPAGTITEALIAINAGADAVYFGMKEFSARKGAGNFSVDDLRKIRKYTEDRDRKIYITINTLIDDKDLPRVYDLLGEISRYGCDGIIVQDLGIADIIRKDFPSLSLHGSTQLAVHTKAGVRALQELGFSRAVLARELTIKEIEGIRKACPDIELKVFIHGALCYGFSGLCMASHIITGRSANEGACAQICRTWFTEESTGRKLYPFSMEDLNGAGYIMKLRDIGIDSLKVEGRMKGPEYAEAVTRYYRSILDSGIIPDCSDAELSFSRKHGPGFLESSGPGHHILTTGPYTGHSGKKIGMCIGSGGGMITVESSASIQPRDGLMLLVPDGSGLVEPLRFGASISGRKKTDSGMNLYTLHLDNASKSLKGLPLYMISKSSSNTRIPSSDLPMAKERIPASISINGNELLITAGNTSTLYHIDTAPSEKSPLTSMIRAFSSSDKEIQLIPRIDDLQGTFYVNPSRLKEIRRDFIDRLEKNPAPKKEYKASISERIESYPLPPRKAICGRNGIPWCTSGIDYDGITYITMPPVRFEEEKLWSEVLKNASMHEHVRIGMNNISDIIFAQSHPEFEFFADIYLYIPNREAAELLKEKTPSFIGGYLWMERGEYEEPWPFRPAIAADFTPPLFISRACIRHDGMGENCSTCPGRNGQYRLWQNGRHYLASFHECMTIVSELPR